MLKRLNVVCMDSEGRGAEEQVAKIHFITSHHQKNNVGQLTNHSRLGVLGKEGQEVKRCFRERLIRAAVAQHDGKNKAFF